MTWIWGCEMSEANGNDSFLLFQKLVDLSLENRITLNLLKEHDLCSEQIVEVLYTDLDKISYEEALIVAKGGSTRKRIWKRRDKINKRRTMFRFELYTPSKLLDKVEQYYFILKARDNYIALKDAAERLSICGKTLRREMKKESMPILGKKYIYGPHFEKLNARKVNGISVKDAVKELRIKRDALYRLLESENIRVEKGCITQEDVQRVRSLRGVSVSDAMEQLKLTRQYVYHITKAAGVSFINGYMTKDEFNVLKSKYDGLIIESAVNKMKKRGRLPFPILGAVA